MFTNAGDDIMKFAAFGTMVKHIIGGQQGHSNPMTQDLEIRQPLLVIAMVWHGYTKPDSVFGYLTIISCFNFSSLDDEPTLIL